MSGSGVICIIVGGNVEGFCLCMWQLARDPHSTFMDPLLKTQYTGGKARHKWPCRLLFLEKNIETKFKASTIQWDIMHTADCR
uniref:Uncharacterized protein n=1 Tax=Anguilla anguilla TaxID=7936 RepID=A0A0E9PDV6_ANGAN